MEDQQSDAWRGESPEVRAERVIADELGRVGCPGSPGSRPKRGMLNAPMILTIGLPGSDWPAGWIE